MFYESQDDPYGKNDARLVRALNELLTAFWYSLESSSDKWSFAVSIQSLLASGMTKTDLRWLILKKYVEHAREVSAPVRNGREFRPIGNLTFCRESCFVLTAEGAKILDVWHQDLLRRSSDGLASSNPADRIVQAPNEPLPRWCPNSKQLSFHGQVVKRFRWRAMNQETVLAAFQEDGWPLMIDDPLPPKLELDPKRRLHDTIKALNQNQESAAIRFHGNGTGEGVRWEVTGKQTV